MSSSPSTDSISRVARRVLQDAAFVFAEEVTQPPRFVGAPVEVSIRFSGSSSGRICMRTYADLGSQMAADMLGEDAGDQTQEQGREALGEILNMIAGPVLSELLGAAQVCDLGAPQFAADNPKSSGAETTHRCCLLTDEDTPIELRVYIESGPGGRA